MDKTLTQLKKSLSVVNLRFRCAQEELHIKSKEVESFYREQEKLIKQIKNKEEELL